MSDQDRLVLPGPDPALQDESRRRAAYRAWVRAHHPDRGGDPTAFARGLQVWQDALRQPTGARPGSAQPDGPLTFHRTRRSGPFTWWAARRAARARPARVR